MKIRFETKLDYFLFFIIFIKILFILSAIGHLILSYSVKQTKANKNTKIKINNKLEYFKELTEFIFIVSMSTLLMYHFSPNELPKPINQETSLLFFLFGCILILTSKWSVLIPR